MTIRKDLRGFGADLDVAASVVSPAAAPIANRSRAAASPFVIREVTSKPVAPNFFAPAGLSQSTLKALENSMPGVGGGVSLPNEVAVKSVIMPATPDLNAAYAMARGIQLQTTVPPVKPVYEQAPPTTNFQPLTIQQQGPLPKQELPADISAMPQPKPVYVPDSSVCPPGYAKDYTGDCRPLPGFNPYPPAPKPPPAPVWKENKLPTITMNISSSAPLPEDMSAMPDAKPVNPNVAVPVRKAPSALPLMGAGAAGGFAVGGPVGAAIGGILGFFLHKPPAATLAPEQSAVVRAQAATLDVSALTPSQQAQYEAEKAAFLAEGGAAGMTKVMEQTLDNSKPGVPAATLQGFGRLRNKRWFTKY